MSARAVAAKEKARRVSAVFTGNIGYPVYARYERTEYPENIGVRHERIFRAEYRKPAAAYIGGK